MKKTNYYKGFLTRKFDHLQVKCKHQLWKIDGHKSSLGAKKSRNEILENSTTRNVQSLSYTRVYYEYGTLKAATFFFPLELSLFHFKVLKK